MAIIKRQTDKLLSCSKNLEIWSASKYGSFVRFLSQDTLFRVRKLWTQYSRMAGLNAAEAASIEGKTRDAIRMTLEENHSENAIFLNGIRSATVHWARAMTVLSSCFRKFWETGVVAGNVTDISNLGEGGYGRVNPLFAISSAPTGRFAVHYGTNPLLGFHLSSAFDDETCSEQELTEKVVTLAKSQFWGWCTAVKNQIHSSTLQIKFFCGDALRLCYGLQVSLNSASPIPNIVRAYTSPWSSTELVLLDPAWSTERKQFDIIDTSNLIDHVGMLNVLPAVVPLLSRRVFSVLFTNSLLRAAEDITAALPALLCSDVTTISLILGLAPTAHLFPYTPYAVGLEEVVDHMASKNTGRQSQYHMGISWRIPSFGDSIQEQDFSVSCSQLVYQVDQLARYFFKLYLTMFSCEDMESMMNSLMRRATSPLSIDLQHYTRMTFITLLFLAKTHVQTDWAAFMSCLLDMIQANRQILVGSNSVQELYILLHQFGLFTSDVLKRPPHSIGRTPYGQPRVCQADTGLLGRESVPPIVYLTLTVPRQKLEIFTEEKDPRGTPGLHVSVWSVEEGFDNSFFAIQCFFGKLDTRSADSTTCDVIPDEDGWRGLANLIVTCAVPTWSMLLGAKGNIRVALTISSTPSTCHYMSKLGIRMTVFECGLESRNLRFWTEPPGVRNNPKKQYATAEQRISSQPEPCFVHIDENSCAKALRVRKASKFLNQGTKPVVTQISPCTLTVGLENSAQINLSYPYPIDGQQLQMKLTSGAVELTVSTASALSHGGYNYQLFPMYMCERQPISLLIPSMNLDKQPVIPTLGNLDWINQFMGMTLSSTERKLHEESSTSTYNTLLQLKSSIIAIFQSFTGVNAHRGQFRAFQLTCKHKNYSSDTLLFASTLRHNVLLGSVLLDAYVVPLSKKRVSELSEALTHLVTSGKLLSIILKSHEEEILWKKLLPVQVECCRQAWHHQDDCQYCSEGLIPLSLEHSQLPICTCGENKDIHGFPRFQNWEILAKYATRIAIIPLSATPYLGNVIGEEQKKHNSEISAQLRKTGANHDNCDNCGQNVIPLKKCSQCRSVSYCSRECQKAAWRAHKRDCKTRSGGS
ncbi:hypothetical protein N7522_006230 [Penicillium canescens]|nr:hypothetical protein N7522_006230 [Penicillium canescens]